MTDPNPIVAGRGFEYLRARGIAVTVGVRREEAAAQHAAFSIWVTEGRPFVTAKVAVSADGLMGRAGERVKLTGPEADRYFHRQRAEVDAIAVGAGTVLVDDPLLTARGAYRYRPLTRVVFDWRGRVPAGARVFATLADGPVIMVVTAEAVARATGRFEELAARGVALDVHEAMCLGPVLDRLARRGVVSLLVEGGAELHRAFADAGLVDRVQIVTAPRRLGEGVSSGLLRFAGPRRTLRLGEDELVEIDVYRTR
jgi:diaminohydroxyphosphoribosylaminopyrimidine deaminase/5-amino-6-(5-phosphoribosylamino)uracil reductase